MKAPVGRSAAFLIACFLFGCGDEPSSQKPSGAAGSASGGTTGQAGGATGGGAGTGGASAGSGGTAGTSAAGGAGGGAGGSAGSGGAAGMAQAGAGGGDSGPSAVAALLPTAANTVQGTATFTAEGDSVKLVIELSSCPDGAHAAHIHQNKSCDDDGNAAGGHWVPNGEVITDITCAGGTAEHTLTPPAGTWSIGDASPTDVTTRALIVHEGGTGSEGGRIACGVIDAE